ncbi:MAG: peptidoglycan DD-metalloendopeptidase family protein [Planctomycetota bacterium]|jgi:murein DD-endopeptidase MepM/ murein hydrolase activator NlpD
MRYTLTGGMLAIAALAAGCNGSGRGQVPPERRVVRTDPALEAGLKGLEEPRGFKHTVRKGETLYALSRRYNVPIAAVIAANPGLDAKNMKVGSQVVIPGAGSAGPEKTPAPVGPKPPRVSTPDRGRLRYPVRSKYRLVRGGNPGAEFPVSAGTTVVAAGKGKVVLATPDLGGLGPTVMIDHGGGLLTMYAKLGDYAVRAGQHVKRGDPLGRAGGAGLLFRVYSGSAPKNPATYIE